MEISTIVPTYNRLKDLKECLDSIFIQKFLPKEVIIIDNSDKEKDKIEKIIEDLKPSFAKKGVNLKYIRNEKENSLTVAKNIGTKYASGEIISFLDDDVTIDEKYYDEIIKIYGQHPEALGVEGKIVFEEKKGIKFILLQILGKLFYLGFKEKNKCKLLPSLGVVYPMENKIVNCEWLSGASTFKRIILKEIKPDENLKKYSDNEDLDLSYRIFKKYPGSLFFSPEAKYWHKLSNQGRLMKRDLIYMSEIYRLYLFYKLIDQNLKNKLIYLWSRVVGEMIFKIISVLSLKSTPSEIIYLIKAYFLCLTHIGEIKNGDLKFFNENYVK